MELKRCRKGEVIIRQGDPGECMYSIRWGGAAVYSRYGTPEETKLAELGDSEFFGEMELLDHTPCSATVVATADGTQLEVITEEDFREFLTRQPAKAYFILQRLCHKLRKTTQDYLNVCRTVYEAAEDEKNDRKQSAELERGIADICAAYREQA